LEALTKRDAAANTLDVAINLPASQARLGDADAPIKLAGPAPDSAVTGAVSLLGMPAADDKAPLSSNQKTMAALALAIDLQITDPQHKAALVSNHQKLVEQGDAAKYIQQVENKVRTRRENPPPK
jgi:hypothetical protein